MSKSRLLVSAGFVLLAASLPFVPLGAQGQKKGPVKTATEWIWLDKTLPDQTVYFRKDFVLGGRISSAKLYGTCDNQMTVYINGREVLSSNDWEYPVFREVTENVRWPGKNEPGVRNVIAVKARNLDGPAGLVLRIVFEAPKKQLAVIGTDGTWRVSDRAEKGWHEIEFDHSRWSQATVVGKLGAPPWTHITETSLGAAAKFNKPTATPIELIKVKKDFKVEMIYSVPKKEQGSWVAMCVDPKGRLIASDQYGKLYRVTPPPLGGRMEQAKVEELPVELGEAQGLVWAFDSLYVVVNEGKTYRPRGLWRVRSSKGDDVLDTKELLREIQGSGEHGPHAVLLGPDGKSLYVLCGNHTRLTKLSSSKVPLVYGEDFLVPRQWDASGHATGILAPGGYICKVDPDGKNWELVSVGYRNHYDAAFNREGELFTYDSDMEWDMNLPWYRATRVCHAVLGSEFGWRSGTSNMPAYYADTLPPAADVGPGSPTGVCFGYGARFPAKYQEALFLCDWSYGKLYVAHLKPHGSSYTAELEEFMNGSPLPLTDIVVNPKDGAMYFATGGRVTDSGVYRITYVGKESTEPSKGDIAEGNALRTLRRKLEALYGTKDPQAVDTAWAHLSSDDWFIRFAARTVLEFRDPTTWQERALRETQPTALTHALIGLVRVGDKGLEPRVLEALERPDWAKLSTQQKLDLLRAYQLTFIRMGAPDAAWKERVSKRIDGWYPSTVREVNSELVKLVSYLEIPGGVTKTLALLAKAPTQEEQIDYAFALRTVKTGWTLKQRGDYFNWFHQAATYRGGHSFHGFLRNIRSDAVKSLSLEESISLHPVLAKVPEPRSPKFIYKERPLVKKYTVEELVPVVEQGLTGRDYVRGRNLFGETKCFACHRFNNEGGGTGPDLTGVSGRFGPRDLLESIIEPSKVISDQYAAIMITTTDGRAITGRIVNLHGDTMMVNTDMLDPNKLVGVNRKLVDTIEPSKVSMMPEGLIDTLNRDEILDLIAYLYSRGDPNHKMFRREKD